MIKKGSWIEVKNSVICNNHMPVTIFIRGYCLSDCELGDETEIRTVTGHIVKGIVSKNNTFYLDLHGLGKDAKEILMIKR